MKNISERVETEIIFALDRDEEVWTLLEEIARDGVVIYEHEK